MFPYGNYRRITVNTRRADRHAKPIYIEQTIICCSLHTIFSFKYTLQPHYNTVVYSTNLVITR